MECFSLDSVERRFRDLHESAVKEYDDALHQLKAQNARLEKIAKVREEQRRDFLQSIGANIDQLEKDLSKDTDELKAFLDEARPSLISRPSVQARETRENAFRAATAGEAGQLILRPYAASVMAPEASMIANIEGERGNPWVFPTNPGQINIQRTSTGSGWGCWAVATRPTEYNVYFYFVPQETARYSLTAIFAFHGFYILRSDDGIFSCKTAYVTLDTQMNAYQYAYLGWKTFPLIDRHEDNVSEFTTYDRTNFFDYSAILKAGDPVLVIARVRLECLAKGGGSYAELNFDTGTANYIEPLFLSVGPG